MNAARAAARVLVGALLLVTLPRAGAVPPGEYVTAGGWGWLTVVRDPVESLRFELYSIGPNAHSCALAGVVRNDVVTVGDVDDPSSRCDVSLRQTARGLVVAPLTMQSCRGYCGVRAGFDGEYLRVPHRCTRSAKSAAGAAFLDRYRAGRYRDAIDSLRPVLAGCAETLEPTEAAHLRNDLAVAYFHAHDRRACMEVLQPLIGPEADRRFRQESWLPADLEAWSAVRDAAQTNVRLCSSLA